MTGSPAIDHIPPGSCTVGEDQHGVARPQGDVYDIGVYEFEAGGVDIYLPIVLKNN